MKRGRAQLGLGEGTGPGLDLEWVGAQLGMWVGLDSGWGESLTWDEAGAWRGLRRGQFLSWAGSGWDGGQDVGQC